MRRLVALIAFLVVACKPVTVTAPEAPPVDYSDQFLYWCAGTADGRCPVYVESPACAEGSSVSMGEWDHYPITVNAESQFLTATAEAIYAFNKEVGFELFQLTPLHGVPDITVLYMGDHFWAAAEAAQLTLEGKHRGAVLMYDGARGRADTIMHELGHLVGLRHDSDNLMSIMYPSAAMSRLASLEPQDIAALRQRYLT